MKSVFKVLGIIALAAVVGFSMAACDNGGGDGGGKLPSSLQNKTYTNSSGDKLVFGTNNVTVTTSGETKTFAFYDYQAEMGFLFFDNSRDEVIGFDGTVLGMVKLTFPSGQKILMGTWTISSGTPPTPPNPPAGNSLNGTTWTGSMPGVTLTLTFTGNTYKVVGSGQTYDQGTYSVSGNNVTFSGQDGTKTGTLNGQTLTVNGIGTFTKQP